jgi:hypothetical protein
LRNVARPATVSAMIPPEREARILSNSLRFPPIETSLQPARRERALTLNSI